MIQELFGGGSAPTGLLGERKISIPFSSPPSQTCPNTSTPILTTNASIATTTSSPSLANLPNSSSAANINNSNNSNNNSSSNSESNNPNQQNLRCPRCDSTNTKFCYYNNYNLTQPRHFCKTCRRYWTKGGTLRNVPIGGGCRKNKSVTATTASTVASFTKSSSNAMMAKANKATLSTELLVNGNPGFLGNGLLDHLHHHPELQHQQGCSNPILWPSLQQNSHILSLLRGSNQFHNPSPSPMSNVFTAVKTEGNSATTNLGLDSYGNAGAQFFARNSNQQQQQQQANGFTTSGVQEYVQNNGSSNNNIIELYQRLKSSSNYNNYCGNENQGTVIFGNMMGPTSSPSSPMHSTILDSAPVGGGDSYGGYSFMSSPAMSGWSDFPTVPINGAYP